MQKMMDALVKPERAKGLILTQVPVPEPGIGEVLIKIHKTAICGTDVHIYNWDPWSQQHINPPMVIGHEYVGEIAALGPGVTEYKGVGVDRQGAFAEYVCIPKTNVILMPDDIPEDIISFFDAYGNATHTATMFDVVGEDVLITGAGPIGMMAVGICRQNGARNIIVTDVNDYRLNIAKQMGATATVNLTHEKLEDAMAAHRMVEGFDVGLEMSGNGKALNQLLKSMRNGGKVALLGIAGPGTVIDWNDVIFKGLNIQGIYGRKMFETWYKMIAMIQAGLDLTPIITHRYHYTEFEKGFEAMNSGHSGKVILSWEK